MQCITRKLRVIALILSTTIKKFFTRWFLSFAKILLLETLFSVILSWLVATSDSRVSINNYGSIANRIEIIKTNGKDSSFNDNINSINFMLINWNRLVEALMTMLITQVSTSLAIAAPVLLNKEVTIG